MPQRVQGDNSSLHGDFEDVGHVPKVVHFEPLKVATKWCTLTGRRHNFKFDGGIHICFSQVNDGSKALNNGLPQADIEYDV